jgi:hypothetical protein
MMVRSFVSMMPGPPQCLCIALMSDARYAADEDITAWRQNCQAEDFAPAHLQGRPKCKPGGHDCEDLLFQRYVTIRESQAPLGCAIRFYLTLDWTAPPE